MADEQTAASVAEDQRATDPRLEQQQIDPPASATEEPAAASAAAAAADGDAETPETPAEGVADPPVKPKKTAEDVLKGRVGHLTKTLSGKDQEIADFRARLEAAEALLAAGRASSASGTETPPAASPAVPTVNPTTGRTFTEAEFTAAVAQQAAAETFNRQANAMYEDGATKFTDWKDSVESLNATGIMSPQFLDAAMATDDGAAVIHHLGSDLAEAERVAALPPIRMAAELTKLAARLSAPKSARVSDAPAPIKPVNGAVSPTTDLQKAADTGNDNSAYAAARAKQGAFWAQPRGKRAN